MCVHMHVNTSVSKSQMECLQHRSGLRYFGQKSVPRSADLLFRVIHAASDPKDTDLSKAAVLMCEKAKHERMTEDSRGTCASCMGHHKIRRFPKSQTEGLSPPRLPEEGPLQMPARITSIGSLGLSGTKAAKFSHQAKPF